MARKRVREPLENEVRRAVTFDILQTSLNSLGGKAKRRRGLAANYVQEALVTQEEVPEGVVAYIDEKNESAKARTMQEAIEAFKARRPVYGAELQKMIDEEREKPKLYAVVALAPGYRLTQKDYRLVMRDLGIEEEEADRLYEPLISVCERLGKTNFGEKRSILLE